MKATIQFLYNNWVHFFGIGCIVIIVVLAVLAIPNALQEEKQKDQQLKIHCPQLEFYSTNFRACERLGVRP